MVGRHKNRWLRRWLVVIVFWAVPVMIVAVNEIREEMAYNAVDLDNALTTWQFTEAQRAAGAPAAVLAAKAPRQQEAINEYAVRKSTLAGYLWHAFVGYWVVPAVTLFIIGTLIGGIRRALRRPPAPAKEGTAHH
jgi:hypothetical protein